MEVVLVGATPAHAAATAPTAASTGSLAGAPVPPPPRWCRVSEGWRSSRLPTLVWRRTGRDESSWSFLPPQAVASSCIWHCRHWPQRQWPRQSPCRPPRLDGQGRGPTFPQSCGHQPNPAGIRPILRASEPNPAGIRPILRASDQSCGHQPNPAGIRPILRASLYYKAACNTD